MSVHGRAGNKRRGNAPARRPANAPKPTAADGAVVVAEPVAATASAVQAEKPSSRPPMPEAPPKSSRPPMPEAKKDYTESKNPVMRRFGGLEDWFIDTRSEMRKIVWPSRETTKNLTILVICISIFLGMLLGGIDYLLRAVFEALP